MEIKEDLADAEKSTEYLKMLCKNKHIRADKKLYKDKGVKQDRPAMHIRICFLCTKSGALQMIVYTQNKNDKRGLESERV